MPQIRRKDWEFEEEKRDRSTPQASLSSLGEVTKDQMRKLPTKEAMNNKDWRGVGRGSRLDDANTVMKFAESLRRRKR